MEEENTTQVMVKPIKQVIIFECTELTSKEFFERMSLIVRSRQPIQLNWAEGVIFVASPYQPKSDIIIKEALKGIIYWSSVIFTSMPKYERTMKFGAFAAPIIDRTSNPTLRNIAEWLKKREFLNKVS